MTDGLGGIPSIWILTHRRLGDLKQMQALAAAIPGAGVEVKQLTFRMPSLAALPALGMRLLTAQARAAIAPPCPDLVFCAEATTTGVARFIRAQGGGATKIVGLGRPRGSISDFDLVITTPQFRIAPAPNVLTLPLPVATPLPPVAEDEVAAIEESLVMFRRPWIAMLVGGSSPPDRLDRDAIERLTQFVRQAGNAATFLLATSPRTPAALLPLLQPANFGRVFAWRKDGPNAYGALLRLADGFVVTSDSASLLTDALDTGKPVSVFPLSRRPTPLQRLVEILHARAAGNGSVARLLRPLFDSGLVERAPDRAAYAAALLAEGALTPLPDIAAGHRDRAAPLDRVSIAASRVAALIASG